MPININASGFTVASSGELGPVGPTGVAGPTGAAGSAGPNGPTGSTGVQGLTGVQGPIGDLGPTGPTGATGVQGPDGNPGAQGSPGPTGPTGATGVSGPIGQSGPTGPTGATGLQGPSGLQGATGVAGNDLQAVTTAGNTTTNTITINNSLAIRASSNGAVTTQIPVFTASPASTARTIFTKTPLQLRLDMAAAPLLGNEFITSAYFEEPGVYSFSSFFTNLPKHFYLDISHEGPGDDGSNLQRGSANSTHYAKGVRSSTSNLADITSSLDVASANVNTFIFTDMGIYWHIQ